MKVTYRGLNMFFDGKLPSPEEVAKAFTFHSWEIEEMEEREGTTVLDVKVLPDKSAWALSHRGIAKDLSVVLNMPLAHDPFSTRPDLVPKSEKVTVELKTSKCRRYIAAHLTGVKVRPSPEWLQADLRALGQRPINNIVDITNYVMLGVGQPLHAFDAKKLSKLALGVRNAKEGEKITTLTGEEYTLSSTDMVIFDGGNDAPVGIAGVKGGKAAEIDEGTTDIVIESANFDPVSVRKTSQRLKLRTEASMRYENGVVPDVTAFGIRDAVKYIVEFVEDFGGGTLEGYVDTGAPAPAREKVSVTIQKLNSVLGLSLSKDDVDSVIKRFGYPYEWKGDTLTVEPPFERPDLVIPEDLIEEIGRIYGYDHVRSVVPDATASVEMNQTFYYVDLIRDTLADAGFSEVFTSSFREKDEVKLANAFAADKGYLRSNLRVNMDEALAKNAPMADLLGVSAVRLFEVGTVFNTDAERLKVAIGVRSPGGYKAKIDQPALAEGIAALSGIIGDIAVADTENGIAEIDLTSILKSLPKPEKYRPFTKTPDITYQQFSQYPFVSRDVAFWVGNDATSETLHNFIRETAGPLLVRLTQFDRFEKAGRVSYGFRLILQSFEKTLSEEEITEVMDRVYNALKESGYEIR